MSERKRLENRRLAIASEFWHRNQRYRCHIGRFPDGGSIAELFLDSARPNSWDYKNLRPAAPSESTLRWVKSWQIAYAKSRAVA
jgi:hypothetical protein